MKIMDVKNPYEYDEMNMHMDNLIVRWGTIYTTCDGKGCEISDPSENLRVTAETLLVALRLAVEATKLMDGEE